MKKKALIVQGGWDGHQPKEVSEIFRGELLDLGFEVIVSDSLESLKDLKLLQSLDLLVPVWTVGEMSYHDVQALLQAVEEGVGIAGCHGGMCDTFRSCVEWQFMTGGNWVAHPGNAEVTYVVNIKKGTSPLVEGIEDFTITSEQYYLHVDPAVEVLATTRFPLAPGPHAVNGVVDMPQVWTKRWGKGRIFYSALGHDAKTFEIGPVLELMRRGFVWASKGKEE